MKPLSLWKKILFACSAVCIGLGIALAAMELALQIIFGPVSHEMTNADPVLHHFSGKNPNVNSVGFYDIEHPAQKPEGTIRVMVVGDSLVQRTNQGVRFSDAAKEHLNAAYPNLKFEVWNCGIDSYSPALEFLLIRHKLIQYNPDLIVECVFLGNDFNDEAVYESTMDFDQQGRPLRCSPDRKTGEKNLVPGQLQIPFKNYLRSHSRLYRELSRTYNTLLHWVGVRRGEWGEAKIDLNHTAPIGTLSTNISDALFNLLTRNVLFTQELLNEHHCKYIVVLIPLDIQVYFPKIQTHHAVTFKEEDTALANANEEKLRAFLVDHGIEVLDLLPPLRKHEPQPLYIPGSHFNAEGHHVVGQLLFEEISKFLNLSSPGAAPPGPGSNRESQ